MGLFTRYAMDALMKTSHPEVVRRQCWNLHPHRPDLSVYAERAGH